VINDTSFRKIILKKEGDELEWTKNESEILKELPYAELVDGCKISRWIEIVFEMRLI
jgi:hypothetical protein